MAPQKNHARLIRRLLAAAIATLAVLVALLSFSQLRPAGHALADGPQAGACGDQPFAQVDIDGQPQLWLEVAATEADRERGLMYRQQLDPSSGMLFIFDTPTVAGFWMRNTYIPLSIIWLNEGGIIVGSADMQPLTDVVHSSNEPYTYAIEANLGWFAENGVGVGQHVTLCLPGTPMG